MTKICPNCGKDIKKDAKFCPFCGYKFKDNPKSSVPIAHEDSRPSHQAAAVSQMPKQEMKREYKNKTPQKPISKKNKIIYSVIGVLVILLICFYAWGSNYYNRDNQISRIVSSLKNPNQSGAQYISCDNPEVKITTESVKPLQRYFQDHTTEADQLITDFRVGNESGNVRLAQTGRYFLLFPKYTAQVTSVTPKLVTNHANSEVKIGKKSLGKLTKSGSSYVKTISAMLPGKYNFSIKSNVEGRNLTATSTNNVWSSNNINLDIHTETLEIKSVPNGIVYINDKKVGTLNNGGNLVLKDYPITKNMTLYVQGTFNKKTLTSKKISDLDHDLEYGDEDNVVTQSGSKYVIKPEWKGLVTDDEATRVLTSAFDKGSLDEDDFVDGGGNDSYGELTRMFKTYDDEDDLRTYESDVKIKSITPNGNNSSLVTYTVTWTFEHDDYNRHQVVEYTNAILTKDDDSAKIKQIGSGKLIKDHKVSTSNDSDDD